MSQLSRHENALENLTLFSRFWEKYGDAQDERSRQRLEEALRQRLRSLGYRGSFLNSRSDVVAALMADHSPRFLKALFHSVCRDRSQNLSRIPEPFVLKVHQWENPRETRESDFSRTLRLMFSSANPQPVGITYCADFLNDATSVRNLSLNPDPRRPGNTLGCRTPHASVVIGSRQRGGQCEFLIRNTLGRDCNGYDSRWECENGQIWVSERALIQNVNEAGYLGAPLVP